jgi:AAHS family 4-hydroxybenzoate transporter-like MFS transporter
MSGIGGLDRALDSTKVTAFQSTIIGLCALTAMIDGMDTQAIGMVAPAIAADWDVPAAAFGPVFGSSLFSGLIGALVAGQAGDRFGRKPILILSVLVFALGSLATPFTYSIATLLIVRLVTGFGLGGALPIIISITSEFSPKRLRLNIVALMYCGFPFGSVLLYRRRSSVNSNTDVRTHHAGVTSWRPDGCREQSPGPGDRSAPIRGGPSDRHLASMGHIVS